MRGSEGPRGLRGGRWGIPSPLAYKPITKQIWAVPFSFLQSCTIRRDWAVLGDYWM